MPDDMSGRTPPSGAMPSGAPPSGAPPSGTPSPDGGGTKKWYDNLPTIIGVSALGIIAILCVGALWGLSDPPETPLTQMAAQSQVGEQTQPVDETQPADDAAPNDAPQPATETPAPATATTVADSTASATTLGLVAQIVTAIGGVASAAVGGIAGLLIPRGTQTGGG